MLLTSPPGPWTPTCQHGAHSGTRSGLGSPAGTVGALTPRCASSCWAGRDWGPDLAPSSPRPGSQPVPTARDTRCRSRPRPQVTPRPWAVGRLCPLPGPLLAADAVWHRGGRPGEPKAVPPGTRLPHSCRDLPASPAAPRLYKQRRSKLMAAAAAGDAAGPSWLPTEPHNRSPGPCRDRLYGCCRGRGAGFSAAARPRGHPMG